MPRVSDRQFLLNELDHMIKILAIYDEEEEIEELLEVRAFMASCRYLDLRKHIRKNRSMNEMLWFYGEREFKQVVRMKKDSFLKLLNLISDDEVFGSPRSRHRQAPVWVQLQVVLQRLGCDGNGVSVGRLARLAGFSVGSVCKFTERVFKAILRLRKRVISWPNAEERRKLSAHMRDKHGIPGGILIVDGTPVVFYQRPAVDGETFWTKKCHYAMNVQLICDHTKRIRWFMVGWPGSVFDSSVFDTSDICRHPEKYFSEGEFLLADAGYAGKWFICVPYKSPDTDQAHNMLFNELFSSGRTIIEHVNGIWKGRWTSLKGIRTQVKTERDLKKICQQIIVCLILHNLMIDFDDDWEEDIDIEEEEEEEGEGEGDGEEMTGQELRARVRNYLLGWHFDRTN